jgi:ribonuclease BN (tRNA processing enzyme)
MEADHSTPEVVGKLAEKAGVGMVVLTHLVPGDEADPAGAYTDGVSRFFKGRVVAASDLARF